jgi:hypothetical protein
MEAFLSWKDLQSIEPNPGNLDQWMETFLSWKDSRSIESNPAIGISLVATATMDGDGGLSGLE